MTEHTDARHLLSGRRLTSRRHLTQRRGAEPAQQTSPPAATSTPAGPIPGAVPLLGRLDPTTAPVHPIIIDAAIEHSQTTSDRADRLAWARYAHTSSYQLRGPYDPRTRRAALLYAVVLTEHGRVLDAYRLHQHRFVVAQQLGKPDELIPSYRHLAEARHAISQCEQAAAEIHHALVLWHAHHQPTGEGSRILASYAVILAGCGQTHTAWRLLRTYPDLLPDNDAGITDLAWRIVAAQDTHPPLCRRHLTRQPPQSSAAQRRADWRDSLRRLKPLPPPPSFRGHHHG